MIRRFFAVTLAICSAALAAPSPSCAAPEGDLKQAERELQKFFEGTMVTVLLDMPATSQGIDITPEAEKPLAFPDYQARLKKAGISLKRGDAVMVTKVKVKSKLIEFQLGGGGYGTFGDEKASGGSGGPTGKSTREKNLERDLKNEKDPVKRRAMTEELDRLRRDRQHDERENSAESKQAQAMEKQRLGEKALQAGSRFNVRHPDGVPTDALTPEALMAALERYVDFRAPEVGVGAGEPRGDRGVGRGREENGRALRKGATLEDVAALYGPAVSTTSRTDCGWDVTTNRYRKGPQRVEATFIEGVLVRYTLSEE
ncbi:MAG: hypothetical protein AAB011_07425 [Candidatus Eisenbacteria bacterium]|mgnify:CR=1 FL=1